MLQRYESLLPQQYFLDKIQGKKILVMGSGPSVLNKNWQDLDFDGIVTVSFWYNNQKLLDRDDIIFTMYSNHKDMNLYDDRLNKYLDTHDTPVGFEVNPVPFYEGKMFKDFKLKYNHKYVNYWTKDHSNALYIGTAGRVVFFTQNFNPSVIYYVGLDGFSPSPHNDPQNAFRTTGLEVDIATKSGQGSRNWDLVYKGHQDFARIAHTRAKSTGGLIYNLGEGEDYNMSSAYSQKHFPLTEDLKEIL